MSTLASLKISYFSNGRRTLDRKLPSTSVNAVHPLWTPQRVRQCSSISHPLGRPVVTIPAATQTETSVTQDSSDAEKFDWCAHWWPILPVCCLDKERPQGIMLLGVRYVVWWDEPGQDWRVWEDKCPHRLAPLSEGRIMEDGSLMCSYHGRTFTGCGKCNPIPQAPEDFVASKKLDATAFPTAIVGQLLFAWLEPGEKGAAAAAAAPPPPLHPDVIDTDGLDWGASNVPNDFQYWIEQTQDPTHAPYLHNKKRSNGAGGMLAQEEAIIFESEILPSSSITKEGFTWNHGGYSAINAGMKASRQFIAPNCVSVTYNLKGSTEARTQQVLAVPVAPGKTRIFYRFYAPPKTALGRFIRDLENNILPPFVRHSLALARRDDHAIADQDVVIMHYEEAIMRHSGATKDQYMANLPADRGVMAVHRWLEKYGNYLDMWKSRMPHPDPWKEQPLNVLLDRWSRHVGHCVMCQQTMKWAKVLYKGLFVSSTVVIIATIYLSAKAAALKVLPWTYTSALPPTIAGVLAVVLAVWGYRVRQFVISQFISGVPRYSREGCLSLVANKPTGPMLISI